MKYIIFYIAIFAFPNLFSQTIQKNLIEIDTIVGTEINDIERRKYVLFEFVDSLKYNYAQVFSLKDSTYQLEVNYTDGRIFDTILSKSVIDNNKENIIYLTAYYRTLEKQKNDKKNTDSNLNVKLYETIVINGKLAVVNHKTHKKIIIKEKKYYHFKIRPKESQLTIEYNPLESKEKDRFYKYAKVKYVLLSDSTICLNVTDFNFKETIYVQLKDIQAIKQNTFESALKKSMGLPNIYLINPLMIIYTPPILIFNLIFKMKQFDLTSNSRFLTMEN